MRAKALELPADAPPAPSVSSWVTGQGVADTAAVDVEVLRANALRLRSAYEPDIRAEIKALHAKKALIRSDNCVAVTITRAGDSHGETHLELRAHGDEAPWPLQSAPGQPLLLWPEEVASEGGESEGDATSHGDLFSDGAQGQLFQPDTLLCVTVTAHVPGENAVIVSLPHHQAECALLETLPGRQSWRAVPSSTALPLWRQLDALDLLATGLEDGATFWGSRSRGEALMRQVLLGDPEEATRAAAKPPRWCLGPQGAAWQERARAQLAREPLDAAQRRAVEAALSRTFTVWQGPPGTGKTQTLLGFVAAALAGARQGGQPAPPVLAIAETNAGADNLVGGLRRRGVAVVRIGQGPRVRPVLRGLTLDALLRRAATDAARADPAERALLWRRAGDAAAEAAAQVLRLSEVVVATCASSADRRLAALRFPIVALDEAAQVAEPAALVPILRGAESVVIAGDPAQLPPKRLELPVLLLDTQYRMHPAMARFPSARFYDGRLKSGVEASDRPPALGLARPGANSAGASTPAASPLFFEEGRGVERAAAGQRDDSRSPATDSEHRSFENEAEARRAAALAARVVAADPSVRSVAILTPYAAQALRLWSECERRGLIARRPDAALSQAGAAASAPVVQVSTIDAFQGREADVVILSTVRSRRLGFLADPRRINVALTRARRGLVVLGQRVLLERDPTWKAWLESLDMHAE
ncbi:hypothetical protein QBZ16_005268 [Prototheca wickerhamii]|uniref:Uncharacterized protein n=1 Tax=Prototheca wickerhamii TaxID=3111 RepID=A0AAD9MJT8_PROWI|nr:hypothetical protein QBZ16_005268 [Prototheca wickerhamii]